MALRGAGDSTTPLIFMALSAVIDTALNPIFILGLGPAPKMGITGSATATFIAQGMALIGMIAYIYTKDLTIRLRGAELLYIRPVKNYRLA
ncbi:polysaccharide biosynthesis C-terminal domain-containing protein [Sphingopyxis sp. BSNA05]|uniref:polysaccharide biosynthesis C-terminal domain-containing protein n=1 Tax=Sphingopyxis sp. BSNA05 TaxID=1236614 RepID=UPI0020B6ECFA|nr:polysaccharide biosynthesis C-terminal domain-containing protein [Sphingopyxis sp. BSNA05]